MKESDQSRQTFAPSTALLRVLGVGFGIAVTVGGTIGVGILRTPGAVAGYLGRTWAILGMWLLGGIYALLGTNAVVELGTMNTSAGGWYIYARRAFGDFVGFTIGWSDWLAQCATIAILAIAVGEFSVSLLPAWAGYEGAVALITLSAFAMLQWLGIRSSSRTQGITSAAKAAGLLVLVGACLIEGYRRPGAPPATATHAGWGALLTGLVIALQKVIYTYDGWYCAVYFTEEVRNPARNLPRSAFGGVLCTLVIYVLVNGALLYALPLGKLSAAAFPASDVAKNLLGTAGEKAVTALAAVSQFSIINATLMMATRVLYGMGRDGLFARFATAVDAAGTPRAAMVMSTVATAALIVTGTFDRLIAVAAFLFIAIDGSGFLALVMLRRQEPSAPRPYRAIGYPWSVVVLLLGCALFLAGNILADPLSSLYTVILMALSYPAYLVVRWLRT